MRFAYANRLAGLGMHETVADRSRYAVTDGAALSLKTQRFFMQPSCASGRLSIRVAWLCIATGEADS
jgi:hypothetical protein